MYPQIEKLHFVKLGSDGVPEFYFDNTMLSTARGCEGRFFEEFVLQNRPRFKAWALNFGALLHECLEYFYQARLETRACQRKALEIKEFLEFCSAKYREYDVEAYNRTPQYKAVGGFTGFVILITQYFHYYSKEDKLTPVGLEIYFGKDKSVPLLSDAKLYSWAPFRLYLSGRIDFIFDDGRHIGPLDHKTFSVDSNLATPFDIHEGMTGYIYALSHLYKTHFSHLVDRQTNTAWINHLGTKQTGNLLERFKRTIIFRTPWQLEQYRLRQISTCAKIYQMLFKDRPADYDSNVCTNWFHGVCPFQALHRLSNPEDRLVILSKDFVQEEWNPEAYQGGSNGTETLSDDD